MPSAGRGTCHAAPGFATHEAREVPELRPRDLELADCEAGTGKGIAERIGPRHEGLVGLHADPCRSGRRELQAALAARIDDQVDGLAVDRPVDEDVAVLEAERQDDRCGRDEDFDHPAPLLPPAEHEQDRADGDGADRNPLGNGDRVLFLDRKLDVADLGLVLVGVVELAAREPKAPSAISTMARMVTTLLFMAWLPFRMLLRGGARDLTSAVPRIVEITCTRRTPPGRPSPLRSARQLERVVLRLAYLVLDAVLDVEGPARGPTRRTRSSGLRSCSAASAC
jgi:hypothetical protein